MHTTQRIPEPTDRKYIMNCRLRFYRKTVVDNQGVHGLIQTERNLVMLVPDESDQRTQFLSAWLPDTQEEYFELAGYISMPIDSPCRFSIHRGPDAQSERHYLFVMSKGVSDILERFTEGRVFSVTILPESEEDQADYAKDSDDGNYEVQV